MRKSISPFLITYHSSLITLKNLRAFAYDRPSHVRERVARRAPPESRECGKQRAFADAVAGSAIFDDAPRVRDLAPARRRSAREKKRAHVNTGPEKERENGCEIDDAYERAEDDAVRPARAMPEGGLVRQPEEAEDAPARVLTRLYVEVGPEHQPAEEHAHG